MASAQDGEGQSQYDKIIHIRQGTSVPIEGRGLIACGCGLLLWIFLTSSEILHYTDEGYCKVAKTSVLR